MVAKRLLKTRRVLRFARQLLMLKQDVQHAYCRQQIQKDHDQLIERKR